MADSEQSADVTALTVQLLSAYLSNNNVEHAELAGLIRATRAALTEEEASAAAEPEAPAHTPAVSVRKSVASPDHILSLIDGKPYKTLKRHLTTHGLTPDSYRARYGLPGSYPMVAPGFAAARRAIAEKIGLGRRPAAAPAAEAAPAPAPKPASATKPKPAAKAQPAAAAPGVAETTPADRAGSRERRDTLKLFAKDGERKPARTAKPKAPAKNPRAPKASKAAAAEPADQTPPANIVDI